MTFSNNKIELIKSITNKKITMANLLLSIRKFHGLSQVEFAKLLGVSRQHLCHVERGRRTVSLKSASEFSLKLGYSTKRFIRISIQDELIKYGFHFEIEIHEDKKNE